MKNFADKVEEIRIQARKKIDEGPVTNSYGSDKNKVIEILNEALATEIVCVLRYKYHYVAAKGMNSTSIAEEFNEHAIQEQEHVDKIAKRIAELGGKPDYSPVGLAERADTDYVEGETLREMLKEDLIAERIVIGIYQEFIRFLSNGDPTTRVMIEGILSDEEEHADELSNLLFKTDQAEERKEKIQMVQELHAH